MPTDRRIVTGPGGGPTTGQRARDLRKLRRRRWSNAARLLAYTIIGLPFAIALMILAAMLGIREDNEHGQQ